MFTNGSIIYRYVDRKCWNTMCFLQHLQYNLEYIVKLLGLALTLAGPNLELDIWPLTKLRPRADAIIQMHPPPHNFLKLLKP